MEKQEIGINESMVKDIVRTGIWTYFHQQGFQLHHSAPVLTPDTAMQFVTYNWKSIIGSNTYRTGKFLSVLWTKKQNSWISL